MAKHAWQAPEPNEGIEGHLFAHRAVKASRQFLQANPEGKKQYPPIKAIMAGVDHLYSAPGDIPLFEGNKTGSERGKHAK